MSNLIYLCSVCKKKYKEESLWFKEHGDQYNTEDECDVCKKNKWMLSIGIQLKYHTITPEYLKNECIVNRKKTNLRIIADDYIRFLYDNMKQGKGLLLSGATGTYKTHTMSYIAQRIYQINQLNSQKEIGKRRKHIWIKYYPVNALLQMFYDDRFGVENQIIKNNIILLDDFGLYFNDLTSSHFDEISEICYGRKISLIISTNWTNNEIENPKFCKRSKSRWDETMKIVKVTCEGMRGK